MVGSPASFFFFFFNDTATTEIYTLSLHDALPISPATRPLTKEPARLIAVLDADPAWQPSGTANRVVALIPPSPDVVEHVAAAAPSRVLVNLATPGTFDAMLTLRAGGCAVPFWGCLARESDARAVMLGPVD